ncbi:MAG: YabP/YqfC family sporulation protein [Lachnospiraceae bacterium]|nr:YabP/YqfC family sporulation protein [Lachnospiraceae bacterium]
MTQVILYDDRTVHIDGYKNIISFDSEHMCIRCKDKVLDIKGKNLQIDSFSEVKMVISGVISGLEWT